MYTALIKALSAVGRARHASSVAQDMIAAGHEPNEKLCSAIIDSAIERNHVDALSLACGKCETLGKLLNNSVRLVERL